MPAKREMLDQLRSGKVVLSPLSFRFMEGRLEIDGTRRLDALVEASWREGIGGGFGIYLKTDYVRRMEVQTLLSR